MKHKIKKEGIRLLAICAAAFLMALNIKTFVRTGGLIPGGATGITVLLQRIFLLYFNVELPYSLVNILLNAFPIYIGFRFIGKKFTLHSCLVIFLTGFLTDLIPAYTVTNDPLLISVFGGIFNGLAISMCLRMDATAGGTEFLSIYQSQKTGRDSFQLILGINTVILTLAGFLFGWDTALYSIIFQYVSTQVLHLLYKHYQQQTLFIVTNKASDVCEVIYKLSKHGATILNGEGSFEGQQRQVVYSVVSRYESKQVIEAIKDVDESAFVNAINTEQLSGRFYLRPRE